MSFFNESGNYSNIIFNNELDDVQESPIFIEDLDNIPFNKNIQEEEEEPKNIIKENATPVPLFINNENFINYFMHIDYNTPLNSPDIKLSTSNLSPKDTDDSKSKEKILLKKTKRLNNGVITDTLTGKTYYEEKDPVEYRKAKKRIQNRESALRMKKLRENNASKTEEELLKLRDDNEKLIKENISLKKEKMFLIEQIKFMQKIIKESNLEIKLKDNQIKNENIKNDEPVLYYDGSKQKIKGKMFNIFIVCILSVGFIIGECSYDGNSYSNNNSSGDIKLNSINQNITRTNSMWFYFSKIILVVLFLCLIPLAKEMICKIKQIFQKRKRKYF